MTQFLDVIIEVFFSNDSRWTEDGKGERFFPAPVNYRSKWTVRGPPLTPAFYREAWWL